MTRPARSRRSTGEVRGLILVAARELFRRNGYQATSTRDVAARAGVVEAAIFRHFGSKAALFDESVLEPGVDRIGVFVREWSARSTDVEDAVVAVIDRRYVAELYALCRDHRDLLATLVSDDPGCEHAGVVGRAQALIAGHLDDLGSGPAHDDVRLTISLVVGAALLRDRLFDDGDDAVLVESLAGFVHGGIGNPDS